MARVTCREWRRFLASLYSGSWDQRVAQSSSGTTCCETNKTGNISRIDCVSNRRTDPFVKISSQRTQPSLLVTDRSPFELVLLVPDVVGLVVREELGDACGQVAVDAVHVAGRGHNGAHVFVTVLDALLHLYPSKYAVLS